MFLIKTSFVVVVLTAGLLTSPPAAAKPSRIPEPPPSATPQSTGMPRTPAHRAIAAAAWAP